jgi:hypothetical protein
MNSLSSKLTAVAGAVLMNAMIMTALGYLFVLQAHQHVSAIALA